jgi:hypothetical protein
MTERAGTLEFQRTPELVNRIRGWLRLNPFSPSDIDAATAVMLKILDGKCKMTADDRVVMAALYDALGRASGPLLGADIHVLIQAGRADQSEEMKCSIYEKRVLAETMISRPVMKGFKKWIREQGLFELLSGGNNAAA